MTTRGQSHRDLRTEQPRYAAQAGVIDAYFAAVNAGDWTAMARLWAPGAELLAAGAPARHGRADILRYYRDILAGYAQHEDRPGRRITEGSTVVVEIHFDGRTTAGQPVSFDAVDVFDLGGGRIRRLSIWYDTASVARQVRGG